eukprot:scaffold77691_cov30-Tisochrysis_lutea.AAC.8
MIHDASMTPLEATGSVLLAKRLWRAGAANTCSSAWRRARVRSSAIWRYGLSLSGCRLRLFMVKIGAAFSKTVFESSPAPLPCASLSFLAALGVKRLDE